MGNNRFTGGENSSPHRRIHMTNDHHGSSPPGRRRQLPHSTTSYANQSVPGSNGGAQWKSVNSGGRGGVDGRRRSDGGGGGGWAAERDRERGSGNRGRGSSGIRGGRDELVSLPNQGDLRHSGGGRDYSPLAGPEVREPWSGPGGSGGNNREYSRDNLPRATHHHNRPPPPVVIEPSSGAVGVGREWERSPHAHQRGGPRPDRDWPINGAGNFGFAGDDNRGEGGGGGFTGANSGDRGGLRFNVRGGSFRDDIRGGGGHRDLGGYPPDFPPGGRPEAHVVAHEAWDQPPRRFSSRDRGGGGGGGGSGPLLHSPPPGGWNNPSQGPPPFASDRVVYDSRHPPRGGNPGHGNGSFGGGYDSYVHGPGLGGPPPPLGGFDSRERHQRRNNSSRSRSRERGGGGGYQGRDSSIGRDRNNNRMGGGGGRGSYRRSPPPRGRPRGGSPVGRSPPPYIARGRRGGRGYSGGASLPRGVGGRDEYHPSSSGGVPYRNGGSSGGRGNLRYVNGGRGGGHHGGDHHFHSGYGGGGGGQHRENRRYEGRGGGGGWGGGRGTGKSDRRGRSSSGADGSAGSGRRNGGGGGGGDHSGGGDDQGHFKGKKGSIIGDRFEVREDVGLGTFGRVVECWDLKRKRHVAVKVVRKVKKYHESALIEAQILRDVNSKERAIRRQKQQESLCVEMLGQFEHSGHCCLVFECLGLSLYDYLKKNEYRGFPMNVLRPIAQELLQAIEFLHSIKLIHTDLKPENVLLKGWEERKVTLDSGDVIRVPASPNIKVIDFGGATYEHESHASVVNTRQYRAPEVILGLRWLYPSDLWSVGCIIAELFLGDLLFATHNNLEHLALMEKCVGPFPSTMLAKAPRTGEFFDESTWECKGATECDAENRKHIRRMKRLQEITARVENTGMGNLLEKLLTLDPKRRATATEALRHRFFE